MMVSVTAAGNSLFIEKADEQEQNTPRRVTRRKPVSDTGTDGGTDTRGED